MPAGYSATRAGRVRLSLCSALAAGGSVTHPGTDSDHQGLDARFQCRVNDRREMRAVIDRQIVELASLPGLCIRGRIVTAHEPENRRCMPRRAEATEILARRRGSRV